MKTLTGVVVLAAAALSFAGSAEAKPCNEIAYEVVRTTVSAMGGPDISKTLVSNEMLMSVADMVKAQRGACESGVKARKSGLSTANMLNGVALGVKGLSDSDNVSGAAATSMSMLLGFQYGE